MAKKLPVNLDKEQFAAQVRDAVSRAKNEFSKGAVGAAFMSSALNSSKKGFQEVTSASRQMTVNVIAGSASASKGLQGIKTRAGEAGKGIIHLAGHFNEIMEAGHNLKKLGASFNYIKTTVLSATGAVRKFISANKGKLVLVSGGTLAAIGGFKLIKSAINDVRLAANLARKAIDGIKSKVGGFFGGIKGMIMNPFIPLIVGGTALAGVMALLNSSIQKAADLETFQTSFEVLLGGIDKAEKRMKELVTFANTTPFELPEVAAASRSLEVLTHGALSTGKGLTLVGDLASGTNTRFEETAVTVGRLYDAIRSGRSAGESLMRLQEIGGLSGSGRNQIEGLITAGRTVEAWKVAQAELGRFSGMMSRQSLTWNGIMSTLRDAISEVQRQFGKPFMDRAKQGVMAKINLLGELTPQIAKFGLKMATTMESVGNVLVGSIANAREAVGPLGAYLKGTFLSVGNVFLAAMKAGVSVISNSGFFNNLKDGFWGVAKVIGGYLSNAFSSPVAELRAEIEDAMSYLPKSLGGTDERDTAKERIGQIGKERSLFMGDAERYRAGGHMEASQKALARVDELNKEEDEQRSIAEGPRQTVAQRKARIIASGDVGSGAANQIKEGQAMIAKASLGVFKNVTEGLKDFAVEDVLGAKAILDKGKAGLKKIREKGAKISAEHAKQIAVPDEMGRIKGKFMSSFLSSTGGLTSGGLPRGATFSAQGFKAGAIGNLRSSARSTSILSIKERREIEDDRVAQLAGQGIRGQRQASSPLAYGSVRRGDKKRAQVVEREKLREKLGLEKTNSILDAIKARFDQLTN